MRSLRPLHRGVVVIVATVITLLVASAVILRIVGEGDEPPSFRAQACGLGEGWLELTRRGYYEPRSGQIALIPHQPAYMASGGGGWSHSGPWSYLQSVPLVFYGPGLIPKVGNVDRPATLADIAPTLATLMKGSLPDADGSPLSEVAGLDAKALTSEPPRLILTIVWDGGGWNVLEQWPGDWANLLGMMEDGVSFTRASDGSSPSVTPAVHTTLGTGVWPSKHGITGVPVRDEDGEVVDSFLKGESSRFIETTTLAERWDEQTGNTAKIGMVGYEPWHLGMIGKGVERAGGDKDDAVWLNVETNEWITNPDHYRLPPAIANTGGLADDLEELDAEDGRVDGSWNDNDILDQRARWEETPAFIRYHGRALMNLIEDEGYGADDTTDLLFTNFKQIDRVGHYFNMASEEVNESLLVSDEILGDILEFLDDEVGRGRYVVVLTADHGQQPDAADVDGYGIDPNEVKRDIDAEFGPITRAVWPTEVFLLDDAMDAEGVDAADVARFLADYRLEDNEPGDAFTGSFDPSDRLFDLAIPSAMLPTLTC
ncbi:MAG: alkaline phosphatase family protein [Actinomycetota bacterium]